MALPRTAARMRKFRSERRSSSREDAPLLLGVVAWIVALIAFFPVLYLVLTGFKTEAAAVELPPQLFFDATLENYEAIFEVDFLPFFCLLYTSDAADDLLC